jgi:serine O-acetyltransferase
MGSTSNQPPPYIESPHTASLGLLALIREDLATHGGDWTRPGFRALAVHRFGAWRMRIGSKLLRWPLGVLYRRLFVHVRNHYGIELPYSASVGRRLIIEHQGAIVVHGSAVIGNDCKIRQGCTLGNRCDEQPFDAPVLGDRVSVGAGAKLLGRVTLGDDAAVGANAVVLQDVPAGATAVGVPARIINPRGDRRRLVAA